MRRRRFEGSWWPEWASWRVRKSGTPVVPPPVGAVTAGYAPLGNAPGTYVLQESNANAGEDPLSLLERKKKGVMWSAGLYAVGEVTGGYRAYGHMGGDPLAQYTGSGVVGGKNA